MNEHAIQIMFYTSMGTMMLALAFLVWGWHLHDRAFTIHGTSWSRRRARRVLGIGMGLQWFTFGLWAVLVIGAALS